ncbi:hypothetical protein [Nocardioides alcanivorans]|uniref:hypothetical protein n=1 Tax=Nocardioides alcanivorans TaxID=2897352 RepID=UPI001F1FBBF7|nr:hypothetical protein [Nocardioides alcanivorans]
MSTTTPAPDSSSAPTWSALVDDAATFPPGDAALADAVEDHLARRSLPWADLVGRFVVKDTDLPKVRDFTGALSVVITGGAGQLAGPLEFASRHDLPVAAVEIALRDLDDLAGNARRVTAALDAIGIDDDLQVYVELPTTRPFGQWLAAADEIAALEHRLKFRTGGLDAADVPTAPDLAACIDAALDREMPFKCTAGLHRAVRHEDPDGGVQHGFLNVLLATAAAWEGADVQTVTGMLAERDVDALLGICHELGDDLSRARRWFTSFGCCDVTDPHDDLVKLGLLEV